MQSARQTYSATVLWAGLILTTVLVQTGIRLLERTAPFDSQEGVASFIVWYYGCLALVAPVIILAASRAAIRRSEALVKNVGPDDIESVGPLIDALDAGTGRMQRQCKDALIRLLPLLTEEHAHLLDEYRQARLRYIVLPPASPMYTTRIAQLTRNSVQSIALRVAIIRALSHIGNQEALTMFDELLDRTANNAGDRRIQQAVREGRPYLAARVLTEPARSSLLRPSDFNDAESLLRAPAGERDLPAEDLLHISEE